MKLFKKIKTSDKVVVKTQAASIQTLSAADLTAVSGGINPQPLPPGRHSSI